MFVRLLMCPGVAQKVLNMFQNDFLAWQAVAKHADFQQCRKEPTAKAALDRALFELTAVQLFLEGCKETQFCNHLDLEKLTKDIIAGVLSTLATEDTHNVQKNSKQCKHGQKFRRPERAFATSIASKVLEGKHNYDPVQATNAVSSSGLVLTAAEFGKPTHKNEKIVQPTVSVAGIATFQQKKQVISTELQLGLGHQQQTLLFSESSMTSHLSGMLQGSPSWELLQHQG